MELLLLRLELGVSPWKAFDSRVRMFGPKCHTRLTRRTRPR